MTQTKVQLGQRATGIISGITAEWEYRGRYAGAHLLRRTDAQTDHYPDLQYVDRKTLELLMAGAGLRG